MRVGGLVGMCKVPSLPRGFPRFGFFSLSRKHVDTAAEKGTCPSAVSYVPSSVGVAEHTKNAKACLTSLQTCPSGASAQARKKPKSRAISYDSQSTAGKRSSGGFTIKSEFDLLDIEDALEEALGPDSKTRMMIIKRGEINFTSEIFRFYAAILKWEKMAKENKHKKKIETDAKRIVELFVAPGAPYENGCISSQVRVRLLLDVATKSLHGSDKFVVMDPELFSQVKEELKRDIWGNPSLKSIVQEEVYLLACC